MPQIKDIVLELIEIDGRLKGLRGQKLFQYINKEEKRYADCSRQYRIVRKKEITFPEYYEEIRKKRIPIKDPINIYGYEDRIKKAFIIGCDIHKIDLKTAINHSRLREIIDFKQQFTSIMYVYFKKGVSDIGHLLNVDHSTAIHSLTAHESKISSDKFYKAKYIEYLKRINKEIMSLDEVFQDKQIVLSTYKRQKKTPIINITVNNDEVAKHS